MKAKAIIFIHAQKPSTMFGLPMVLAGIVIGVTAPVFGVLAALNMHIIGFISFLVLSALGLSFLWRKQREDCHYQTLVTVALPFWRGKAERRFLWGSASSSRLTTGETGA